MAVLLLAAFGFAAALAHTAAKVENHRAAYETAAGVLLIAGLIVVGYLLKGILPQPIR